MNASETNIAAFIDMDDKLYKNYLLTGMRENFIIIVNIR